MANSSPLVVINGGLPIAAVLGCSAGYERNGANCDICPVNTYKPNDNPSDCRACKSPKTTATNTGQSYCLGEW